MSKKPKMEAALQFRLSEQNHILTYYTLNWQCPQAISKITSGRETVSISILTDVNCHAGTIQYAELAISTGKYGAISWFPQEYSTFKTSSNTLYNDNNVHKYICAPSMRKNSS